MTIQGVEILGLNLIGGAVGGITAGVGHYLGRFHVQPLTGCVAGAVSTNLFVGAMIVNLFVLSFVTGLIEGFLRREGDSPLELIAATAIVVATALVMSIGPSIVEAIGFPILYWEFTALFIINAVFLGLMMHLFFPQEPQGGQQGHRNGIPNFPDYLAYGHGEGEWQVV